MSTIIATPQQFASTIAVTSNRAGGLVLDLRGVSKWYCRGESKTVVLNQVDLQVGQGECVFLLGPSGSGKTTLLSIIGCLLTADLGEVRVLGHDLSQLDAHAAALLRRDKLGFVFQKFHLIRGLSAQENVALPLILAEQSQAVANRRALELLAAVGLADYATKLPSQMSVGQCQRIAIARALVNDPQLVLADEPTASLDAESGQQAMQLLRQLTVAAGKSLIVVTHDHRTLPYADRVLEVTAGKLKEQNPTRSTHNH